MFVHFKLQPKANQKPSWKRLRVRDLNIDFALKKYIKKKRIKNNIKFDYRKINFIYIAKTEACKGLMGNGCNSVLYTRARC